MKAAAPWVRTRLRTAPGPAVALLLLVLVTSFLAAAFPRAVDTYEGQGLRHEMSSASPERSAIQLTDEPMRYEDSGPGDWADSLQSRRLAGHHREILAALPKPLRADTGQSAYGARIRDSASTGRRRNGVHARRPSRNGRALHPGLGAAARSHRGLRHPGSRRRGGGGHLRHRRIPAHQGRFDHSCAASRRRAPRRSRHRHRRTSAAGPELLVRRTRPAHADAALHGADHSSAVLARRTSAGPRSGTGTAVGDPGDRGILAYRPRPGRGRHC